MCVGLQGGQEEVSDLLDLETVSCPTWGWESDPGPLKEQQVSRFPTLCIPFPSPKVPRAVYLFLLFSSPLCQPHPGSCSDLGGVCS